MQLHGMWGWLLGNIVHVSTIEMAIKQAEKVVENRYLNLYFSCWCTSLFHRKHFGDILHIIVYSSRACVEEWPVSNYLLF